MSRVVVVAVVLASACGDDLPGDLHIAGRYATDDGMIVQLLERDHYVLTTCDSPTSCDPSRQRGPDMIDTAGQLVGETASAKAIIGGCELAYQEQRITPTSAATIEITAHTAHVVGPTPAGGCTIQAARALATDDVIHTATLLRPAPHITSRTPLACPGSVIIDGRGFAPEVLVGYVAPGGESCVSSQVVWLDGDRLVCGMEVDDVTATRIVAHFAACPGFTPQSVVVMNDDWTRDDNVIVFPGQQDRR